MTAACLPPATAVQNRALASFRATHAGDTIIVCGCGPSLRDIPDPTGRLTIGVNDVGRLFDPTYLVVVNPRSQFTGDRFRWVEQSNARTLFTQLDLGRVRPPVVRFRLGTYGGTELGADDRLHYTQNSPYVAVCLAAYMGAKRIGLVGVDFTDHHFFAATGRHPLAARLAEIDAQYRALCAALARRGVELVNLSAASRLTSLPKIDPAAFLSGAPAIPWRGEESVPATPPPAAEPRSLQVVSYATTPVAGVPPILARCISARTSHAGRCVWATRGYGNGVEFEGDLEWGARPRDAVAALEAADVVIVHNGKVDARHERVIASKRVVTLAHNYMWNVDPRFVRRGSPGLVVGQYQATLPEFAGWTPVPNPIPTWEPAYTPEPKPDVITICYTPSARHEGYPRGHRLYWHGKGYETTMRVLDGLAATLPIRLEVVRGSQVAHRDALAMKRRAHIVIDECVTGSYHRNSLEGLSTGCVVVNGVGLLPGVADVLRRCAPSAAEIPFVFATLATLETVLRGLIERGATALAADGQRGREWMERHWSFADQWTGLWAPVMEHAVPERQVSSNPPRAHAARSNRTAAHAPLRVVRKPERRAQVAIHQPTTDKVSVVVSHGGADRLLLLTATLATLRQRSGIGEIIVVEMGESPVATAVAERWADKHLFIEHGGAFERARALNAGASVAEYDTVLWQDNDLLVSAAFITHAVNELRQRRLDYLVPYTSIRYLSEVDSLAVRQGARAPDDCRPVSTRYSWHRGQSCSGGIGLVRRDFLTRYGGHIEGFRGWGGEDNAWIHKVSLLGRWAPTLRQDQHAYHLYHHSSGGYGNMTPHVVNPHYAENVELLGRVLAVRQPARFFAQFPATLPTGATLIRSKSTTAAPRDNPLPVWAYWEGACPPWIRACLRTILAHGPNVRVLTPDSFDRLRDRDRDIDLTRLQPAHRADYIRAFLLQRYGGLWVDADCLVMQSLAPVLELLREHDFVAHRERSGLVSNGFIGARSGSRIAASFYARIAAILRARRPLGWNSIGSAPLNAVLDEDASGWHELPCERVQPVCWSHPEEFFAQRTPEEHERLVDPRAFCYMLSQVAVNKYASAHGRPDLLDDRAFFSHLLRRALDGNAGAASRHLEDVFASNMTLYRHHRLESLSGPGSSLEQTRELRERLPLLLEDLGVRSLLDAPCGDFNWMQHVRLAVDEYVGTDVLDELIADNAWKHAAPQRRFLRADVIRDPLPRVDAILCRDLLPHLSFADIFAALENFRRSGATYLLTTTFTAGRPNGDTASGNWRTLDLTLPPFEFPQPERVINEKCTEAGGAFGDKSVAVWRLSDVPTFAEPGEASSLRSR